MLDSPATREGRAEANRTLVLLAAAAAAMGLSATLILTGHRVAAGLAALAGGGAMVTGGLAVRAGATPRVGFADLMLDRLFDACVLAPLAWTARTAAPTVTALALIGLGSAFVASYERAKGQALGYRGSEEVAYRAGRAAPLVLALLTGWTRGFLWAFVALTVAAAAVRAWNVADQERQSSSETSPTPEGT